jgi:hypothetical protein
VNSALVTANCPLPMHTHPSLFDSVVWWLHWPIILLKCHRVKLIANGFC